MSNAKIQVRTIMGDDEQMYEVAECEEGEAKKTEKEIRRLKYRIIQQEDLGSTGQTRFYVEKTWRYHVSNLALILAMTIGMIVVFALWWNLM